MKRLTRLTDFIIQTQFIRLIKGSGAHQKFEAAETTLEQRLNTNEKTYEP